MLGELNWVFTAITDTIAWNILPRGMIQRKYELSLCIIILKCFFFYIDTFQTLFRQDLLVASLLRNFLLAERIMRTYDCEPVSSPELPPMHNHPMWQVRKKKKQRNVRNGSDSVFSSQTNISNLQLSIHTSK